MHPYWCQSDISDILRAYLLFTRLQNCSYIKRYFVIKRFKEGNVFNLCIMPEMENLLGEELTEHVEDKKLYDIGVTEEQFQEYFRWLHENMPEEYGMFMLYVLLREKGWRKKI